MIGAGQVARASDLPGRRPDCHRLREKWRSSWRSRARIAGVRSKDAGLGTRPVYYLTRRNFARLTGRTAGRLEPLEVYAHAPGLLRGYGRLEQATAKLHRVPWRLQVLAELKATTLIGCEFCLDLASQIARRSGLSDEQLLALPRYSDSGLFTDLETPTTWQVRGPGSIPVTAIATGTITPLEAGSRSLVTIALEFRGHGVGKLLAPLIRRQSRRQLPNDQKRLKELLEHRS
jgi:AhpD family alkylhydroperoxidase